MGTSSSKDKGEDGGEVVKSSGFHLVELHIPTAGLGFMSIIIIVALAWLLSKLKTKLVKRYREDHRRNGYIGRQTDFELTQFNPAPVPLLPVRTPTIPIPTSPFTIEDYQKLNKSCRFNRVNKLDCEDITGQEELQPSPVPVRKGLSAGKPARSSKIGRESPSY